MTTSALQSSSEILAGSFNDLWAGVINFLPELVVAIVIFILGWIIGALLGRAVDQIIQALKIDSALRGAGLEGALSRAGFRLNAGHFLGELVKWFIIVVFLVASLDVLGLSQVNVFLQQVVLLYLPQVIVAVLILLVAAVISEAMQNIVTASARAAHIRSARFLGTITKWSIWVFAALTALYQVGIASTFLQTLFTGLIVALSLAFGLSFGLGGQDAAARYIDKLTKEIKHD
jgi:hypothetical protein